MIDDMQELFDAATSAVEDNPRHGTDSIFMLIGRLFPEATDEQVTEAVRYALGDE